MKRFLTLVGILLPGSAQASFSITDPRYGWKCTGYLYCYSGQNAVTAITENMITGVGSFIVALAAAVFIYGAIRMITSQGDEGKEAGKKALIWASIGLAAAMLTGGIIAFINGFLYRVGA